jgi:hypothetical protein
MQGQLFAQGHLVLREAAEVLPGRWGFSPLLAEQKFAVDQVENDLLVRSQPGQQLQIVLDPGRLAALPAPALVLAQGGHQVQSPEFPHADTQLRQARGWSWAPAVRGLT